MSDESLQSIANNMSLPNYTPPVEVSRYAIGRKLYRRGVALNPRWDDEILAGYYASEGDRMWMRQALGGAA